MSDPYPWYDAWFLAEYTKAKDTIRTVRPRKLPEFTETLDGLRTRADFTVQELGEVFDESVMEELRSVVTGLKATRLSPEEFGYFGRYIVRNHPFVTELQHSLVGLASEAAAEPVEPRYNFLSFYTDLGVCPVHMDAPDAKWTLDLCVQQSEPWPIHLSQTVPWPENRDYGPDWERTIKDDPAHRFRSYTLEPGEAIFFSGSSQWHYRDPHPGDGANQFCDLAFFHFIPKGMGELIDPANWARLFDVPELAEPTEAPPVRARPRAGRLAARWRRFVRS